MSTSDRLTTNLPHGWPDVDTIAKLANELFSAVPGASAAPQAGAHAGFPAPVESRFYTPPAELDSSVGGASPLTSDAGASLGTIGIPGQQELLTLLASIPAACAAITESAEKFLPTSTHPQFYFSDASQNLTNPFRKVPTERRVPRFETSPFSNPVQELNTARISAPFDVNHIRRDFSLLQERVNGRELVWLDNAATTQKPQQVIDRIKYFYEHENSNIHRAAHVMAARATDAYEAAREKVRAFLNAGSVKECVFVRGATEGINLVAQSWGRQNIGKDDEIIVSQLEHHANIVPWQQLVTEKGAKLRVIPVDDSGQLLLDEYAKLLGPKTKLVAFTHVSNALGTITSAKSIIQSAHHAGAKVLLDGAQSVSHMPVDVQALDADFFVFSGHKLFGPTGIGVLYGKEDLLNAMPPWQGGGNMIADVTFDRTVYQQAPQRFEAGTGNIADAVGLGAAIDYISKIGLDRIAEYEHQLLLYATRLLTNISGLRLIGTAPDKAGVLSFVLNGLSTEEVGSALNREGIAVRSGHHCAQPILRRFGIENSVRPSLAFYNTCGDIDKLIASLIRIASGSSTF